MLCCCSLRNSNCPFVIYSVKLMDSLWCSCNGSRRSHAFCLYMCTCVSVLVVSLNQYGVTLSFLQSTVVFVCMCVWERDSVSMCPNSRRAFVFLWWGEVVKANIKPVILTAHCNKAPSHFKENNFVLKSPKCSSWRQHLIPKVTSIILERWYPQLYVYVVVTVLLVWLVSKTLLCYHVSLCVCVCCWSNRSVSTVSTCQRGSNVANTTTSTTTNRANMWLKNTAGIMLHVTG